MAVAEMAARGGEVLLAARVSEREPRQSAPRLASPTGIAVIRVTVAGPAR